MSHFSQLCIFPITKNTFWRDHGICENPDTLVCLKEQIIMYVKFYIRKTRHFPKKNNSFQS